MEINILYSKNNAEHQRAATFVRKAVQNLGIRAKIVERESAMASPQVLVNGFDLISGGDREAGKRSRISYDFIEKALERTAW